jgi:hypothetical protein
LNECLICPDLTSTTGCGPSPSAPAGFYVDDSNNLQACNKNCLTCLGPDANHCTSCIGHLSLNLATFTCEA